MNQNTVNRSKNYETYVRLANTKSSIVPIPIGQRLKMGWGYALTRLVENRKRLNFVAESRYMQILQRVKPLLANTSPLFERDYRHCNAEDALAMHAFISETFYWHLECTFHYDFMVYYAFNNCPFEDEIRKELRLYPFDTNSKEVQLQPDYLTFYKNVLRVQDRKYITL